MRIILLVTYIQLILIIYSANYLAAQEVKPCFGLPVRVLNITLKETDEQKTFRNYVLEVLNQNNCTLINYDYKTTFETIDSSYSNFEKPEIILFIDYKTGIIKYEARQKYTLLVVRNSEIKLSQKDLREKQREIKQKIEEELAPLTKSKGVNNTVPKENQCKIYIGSLKVTCSGGSNAEGDLSAIFKESFKNYNPDIDVFKGNSDIKIDDLRNKAIDAKADILVYADSTIQNCPSISESIYILKSEYVGNNSYINQSKILTSKQKTLKNLQSDFFSKEIPIQICWDLFLKNKSDTSAVKYLQTIISNSGSPEERNLAFEEMMNLRVTDNSQPDEINGCASAFSGLVKKQQNTQLALKWMHKLKAITPKNINTKKSIDTALKNALKELFFSNKIPDNFPNSQPEYVFCLWLLNKYGEHPNAEKLLYSWKKTESEEYYISGLQYYRNRTLTDKCKSLSEAMILKYPNIPFGYDFLADYYYDKVEWDTSLKYAKLAISASPSSAEYYVRVSKLFRSLEDIPSSEYYCSIAKSINDTIQCLIVPDSTNCICNLEIITKKDRDDGKTSRLHTIENGDGLASIATRYGVTLDVLKSINGIISDQINTGHKLIISQGKDLQKVEFTTDKSLEEIAEQLHLGKLKNCDKNKTIAELRSNSGNWRGKKKVWYIKRRQCDF